MRKKDELSKPNTCMAHAHPDEMVFVLLGRDAAAPAAIRAWVEERVRLGKNVRTDPQVTEALECARVMEGEGRMWVGQPTHYPPGAGEESRRLHREYNKLGAEVIKLTDECAAKGITLVPGGEHL